MQYTYIIVSFGSQELGINAICILHLCGIPLGQKKNKYYFDFPNSGSISDLSLKSQVEM